MWIKFSGTFTKLRKATISFVMCFCLFSGFLSIGTNSLDTTGQIFMKFDISVFLKKSDKIQVSLESDKITGGTLHEVWYTLLITSCSFLLEWKIFQTNIVGRIKTHILCSVNCFWKFCHLWANVKRYCRAGQATDDNVVHAHFMLYT